MACDLTLGVAQDCLYGVAANCQAPKEPGELDPLVGMEVVGHDRYFTVTWDTVVSFPSQVVEVYYRSLSPISSNTLDDKDGDQLSDRDSDPLLTKIGVRDLSAEDIGSGHLKAQRDVGRVSSEAILRKGMVYKVFIRVTNATEADEWTVKWVYTDEAKKVVTHLGELVHHNGEILIF